MTHLRPPGPTPCFAWLDAARARGVVCARSAERVRLSLLRRRAAPGHLSRPPAGRPPSPLPRLLVRSHVQWSHHGVIVSRRGALPLAEERRAVHKRPSLPRPLAPQVNYEEFVRMMCAK